MGRPGVELEPGVRLRDELRERAGRVNRADSGRLVAATRRGLADRDLRLRAAALDPRVPGGGELRVVGRGDGAPSRVELWAQELLQVRLVPDREEPHERVSLVASRVTRRDRACERGEV